MRWTRAVSLAATGLGIATTASAQGFYGSPTGTALPSGTVTPVGGIVADLYGLNGTRLVAQLAASSLYVGFSNDGTPAAYRGNPLTIGIQNGFSASDIAALGGGLAQAAFRITLYDGDSRSGDFDYHSDFLHVNDVDLGDFSAVSTLESSGTGDSQGNPGLGFGNNILNTGFFYTNNATGLASIYTALVSTNALTYKLLDMSDPTDNYYDFTQGVDGGLINIGTGPVIVPTNATPEPGTLVLFASGLAGLGAYVRRRKHRV